MTALILSIVTICGGLLLMSRRTQTWRDTAGLMLVAAGSIVVMLEAHGLSRPAWSEWREIKDPTVLQVHLDEPRAIYVWLLTESGPRAYALAWDQRRADEARETMERAGRLRGKVRLSGLRLSADLRETEQQFYLAPQPALPPKAVVR